MSSPIFTSVIFFCLFSVVLSKPIHISPNRRFLHEPLFHVPTTASPSPSSSPSNSSFFPTFPSAPPNPLSSGSRAPPSASTRQTTFPANITSLVFPLPHTPSHAARELKSTVVLVIVLPILAITLVAFLLHRCHLLLTDYGKAAPSDHYRLFPTNSTTFSVSSANNSREFLYLGTVVNPGTSPACGAHEPYVKLDSPELHPLPPLSRERGYHLDGGRSSDEEFYSPRDSEELVECIINGAAVVGKSNSKSTNLSSLSYPSSNSVSSKPWRSSDESLNCTAPKTRDLASPSLPLSPPSNDLERTDDINKNLFPVAPPPLPQADYWGMPRPKLKPLLWDKVRANSNHGMVRDHLKSGSFQLNEKVIETLFVCNSLSMARRPALPSQKPEYRILDPQKSQNIAVLLRDLNMTKEEVCEALLEGNTDSLGPELLDTLLKMAPTKEEEAKLREYKDNSPFKLGPAEQLLKAAVGIPFVFKRVEAMLYIANFDSDVNYLKQSFSTLEAACEELRKSRMFLKLLEAVLTIGYRMNVRTNHGDARAFKLDTLLKLVDMKCTDGKVTLLHYVVQEIIRDEGSRLSNSNQHGCSPEDLEMKRLGLQVVSGLSGELSSVNLAAGMDSDVLSDYVTKLSSGTGKIDEVIRLNSMLTFKSGKRFLEAMRTFLNKAEDDIIKVRVQESIALSMVKEITEYFHGESAREDAQPFRIFVAVRDFLSYLDQVCKEVRKATDRTIASSARNMPVPGNPTTPPVFPGVHLRKLATGSSGEDEGDSS